jgi:hypothetical protein
MKTLPSAKAHSYGPGNRYRNGESREYPRHERGNQQQFSTNTLNIYYQVHAPNVYNRSI